MVAQLLNVAHGFVSYIVGTTTDIVFVLSYYKPRIIHPLANG